MPAVLARRSRAESTARTVPLPGRPIPRASVMQFIELAVYMPEQDPQPGQAQSSSSLRCFERHLPRLDGAHALEDGDEIDRLAAELSGEHGPAADEDGGDVEPQGRHEHARDDLVAVGDEDEGVEGVGHGHDLDGVGDELAARQGVLHALVAHGDAVADADGGKLHGRAAGHADARLHMLGDGAQVDVPGDDLVVGVDDPDQGTCDLLVGVAHGLEEGPVGRPLNAFFHQVASHVSLPLSVLVRDCSTMSKGGRTIFFPPCVHEQRKRGR